MTKNGKNCRFWPFWRAANIGPTRFWTLFGAQNRAEIDSFLRIWVSKKGSPGYTKFGGQNHPFLGSGHFSRKFRQKPVSQILADFGHPNFDIFDTQNWSKIDARSQIFVMWKIFFTPHKFLKSEKWKYFLMSKQKKYDRQIWLGADFILPFLSRLLSYSALSLSRSDLTRGTSVLIQISFFYFIFFKLNLDQKREKKVKRDHSCHGRRPDSIRSAHPKNRAASTKN